MTTNEQKIALYGGSFDPIHQGHLMLLHEAKKQAQLDKIVLLPCNQSPHKPNGPVASATHRLAMAKAAASQQNWPWLEVNPYEIDRPGPSYSWQTCAHFRQLYPHAQLFWILGQDQWAKLPTWAKPEYLAAELTFLVFTRNHQTPAEQPPFRAQYLHGELAASSSEIRQRLAAGQSTETLLPSSVARYITEHGLYRG